MALVDCRECKKEVSTEAKKCPHCGAPQPWNKEYNGTGFEWRSERELWGYPLVHIAFGKTKTGKLRVAKGIIAIGQFAIGAITFAQFGIGFLFGFGQFLIGFTVIAQFAISLYFGVGQITTGYIAIGQVVLGYYGLAQTGLAKYIWSMDFQDPEACRFFHNLWDNIKSLW